MGVSQVRRYYDINTASFLRFGQGGSVGAIHRAVWGPGVPNRATAFRYVDDQILGRVGALSSQRPHVADLGCGVGSSLAYLAERAPVTGVGFTLSPVQVKLARETFSSPKLGGRLTCVEADYTALPCEDGTFDLAFAMESFVLGPDPSAFFREAARVLRPGGLLMVCDDFLSDDVGEETELPPQTRRWLAEFRRGWCADSLVRAGSARTLAERIGLDLRSDRDLTEFVELRRPRDRIISAIVALGRHLPLQHPRWLNLLGGNALQMALMRRIIQYRLLVWEKP